MKINWWIIGLVTTALLFLTLWLSKVNANQPIYSCTQAFAQGIHDIKQGTPLYRRSLDRDHDGVACEE